MLKGDIKNDAVVAAKAQLRPDPSVAISLSAEVRLESFIPMSVFREEHLMERELPVQVSLDHVHPALQSWL